MLAVQRQRMGIGSYMADDNDVDMSLLFTVEQLAEDSDKGTLRSRTP